MPKFPKAFARRKSSANVFEDGPEVPVVEHSFKVFERGDTGNKSFDGGVKLAKAGSPGRPRFPQLETENMFENLGNNRGSGASNNTSLTTDNSSRLSAASTAPSSTDTPGREEWKSPHDKPYENIPMPPVPRSTSAFSMKNAGRSLSWGRNKPMPPSPKESKSPKLEEDQSAGRARAVTTSSYASTAKPPALDKNLGLSLGGDFSEMFAGFDKRRSTILDAEESRGFSQSPDNLSPGPASRFATNRQNPPSSLTIDRQKDIEPSPYSWSSQQSHDGLISRFSPSPLSPRQNESPPPPPVPAHGRTRVTTDGSSSFARVPRKEVNDSGLKRTSAHYGRRQSTVDDSMDEDARLLRESVNAIRQLDDPGYSPKVRDSWALPLNSSYKVDDSVLSSWRTGSTETTPRARRAEAKENEDNMFDNQIAASANIAQRFQERPRSPPTNQSPQNKVMTPAQFERYKQDQERLRSVGGHTKDEVDEDEDETYDDDEDEAEKAKQAAKQRRKQEAHMAVYRQQMMKVTGEAAPSRPNMFATQSSPNLGNSGDGEEEDEEVPLAILQAHGFPNKNKPPMRSMGSNPNLRAASAMSMAGGHGGPLPVFARNLPQDPYFGAGLVNPMHRESLAFGGGSGSVSGEPSRGLPPGGLVGVIATEERSRAMRRGSPNAQGTYGSAPSNGFNGMGPEAPSVAGSMYNGMSPGGLMPPMGPMGMMTPGDQAQIQMSQQMQQFMAMQMQFMQMMTNGQAPPGQSGHQSHNSMGEVPRPASAHQLRPINTHQRAMTMMEPNVAPWMNRNTMFAPSLHNGAYAPSIAPSERSNVGLPGRYRPVSQAPPLTHQNKMRTSTMMSGGLGGWEDKHASTTIRQVRKSGNADDEDDEEGWEEMAKKREKKKSLWRTKKDKDPNGLKEALGYVAQ